MNIFVDRFLCLAASTDGGEDGSPTASNKGGRPKSIDDDTLLNQRDCLIQLLSCAWGDIGWKLQHARDLEQLRKALLPLTNSAYPAYQRYVEAFVRPTIIEASRQDIRETREALGRIWSRSYDLRGSVGQPDPKPTLNNLAERLRQYGSALLSASPANVDVILNQCFDDLAIFQRLKAELAMLEQQERDLRMRLAAQEAFFAQNELLDFIHRAKYAHNPRTLAQAMAGLPRIGCWQSFQRCEKQPSLAWPMDPEEPALHYQIFKLIEVSCELDKSECVKKLVDTLRDRIRALPAKHLRSYLTERWRYLRRSIEQTNTEDVISSALPYRILADFMKELAKPRSAEECVLAQIEQREIER